jgi:hypothetical protein
MEVGAVESPFHSSTNRDQRMKALGCGDWRLNIAFGQFDIPAAEHHSHGLSNELAGHVVGPKQ